MRVLVTICPNNMLFISAFLPLLSCSNTITGVQSESSDSSQKVKTPVYLCTAAVLSEIFYHVTVSLRLL